MALDIEGLGTVTEDGDWLVTEPHETPLLRGPCRFQIDGYDPHEDPSDLVACIAAFRSLDGTVLEAATPHVFAYYLDMSDEVAAHEADFPVISQPHRVWDFVTWTREPVVQREEIGGPWYVALENECEWEREHGLMLVFRAGRTVSKVGGYDGHLTNEHASAVTSIPEGAVYWNRFSRR